MGSLIEELNSSLLLHCAYMIISPSFGRGDLSVTLQAYFLFLLLALGALLSWELHSYLVKICGLKRFRYARSEKPSRNPVYL